jgi:dihydrofolate synthase/folylpolyglutamate synthase
VLGSTLEAIAGEKAAIIRGGVAISAAQALEAERVIAARAAAVGVPLQLEGRDLSVAVERRGPDGQRVTCTGPGWSLTGLELAMPGSFQPSNALLAVAAARELGAGDAAIRDGLARAWWPGRFQVLRRGRGYLVLDGAHNPAGARALAVSLRDVFGETPITFVLGILADKDAAGIVAALTPLADRFVLVAPGSARATPPTVLRALVPAAVEHVEIAASPAEALERAERATTPVICVAGSLFLIGDVLRSLAGSDKPCSLEKGTASMSLPF